MTNPKAKQAERRNAERLPVPKMLEVRLRADERECACMLRDVSTRGFMAELIRGECFSPGEVVQVVGCARELNSILMDKSCRIRWRRDRLFGADFGQPLEDLAEDLSISVSQDVPTGNDD